MKIVFFGWKNAFDYYRIGGAESYIRRISQGLISLGHSVSYVMYGAEENLTRHPEGFQATLHYTETFHEALKLIERNVDDIIVNVYTHPKYRPLFYFFRSRTLRNTRQATILFSPFRSIWKEFLGSFDLGSYDSVFVVSERIKKQMTRNKINSIVLPPPVSDVFFETAKARKPTKDGKIRVGYIGRADYGKGFDIAIDVMMKLPKDSFAPKVMTYSWKEGKEIESARESGVDIEVTDYRQYSTEIESRIAHFLSETDFLLLPYRTIDTTVDMPLSIIEGLAAGCRIILPQIGELSALLRNHGDQLVSYENLKDLHNLMEFASLRHLLLDGQQKRSQGKWDLESVARMFLS